MERLRIKDQRSAVLADDPDQTIIFKGRKLGPRNTVTVTIEDDSRRRKPKPKMKQAGGRRSGDRILSRRLKREAVEDRIVRAIDRDRERATERKQAQAQRTDAERAAAKRARRKRAKARKAAAA